MTDEQKTSVVANVPLGRIGTLDDMGKMAVTGAQYTGASPS
jgi:hypothetical protein